MNTLCVIRRFFAPFSRFSLGRAMLMSLVLSQSVFAESGIRLMADSAVDNSRLALDFSSRGSHLTAQNPIAYTHAAGFDWLTTLSGSKNDIGTLLLQGYITRLHNTQSFPGFFQDEDDTEFVYRIFNFNYTALPGNLPNIRIGHMEVPYGLEHAINTNGTLRQYAQPKNLGIKADWGVSLNKQLKHFEYEVSATTGGGQSLDRQDSSYVFAGRVGSLRDENLTYGLSWYRSKLKNIERERLGLDLRYYRGLQGFYAELSLGQNNDQEVRNGQLEWNVRNQRENIIAFTQLRYFSSEQALGKRSDTLDTSVGIRYALDNSWTLSSQYSRDLDAAGKHRQSVFSIQVRYRYFPLNKR